MGIFIPKLLVATVLLSEGCVWLAASRSFLDLILNSLALAFVTNVDELLHQVYLPVRLQRNLENSVLACPLPNMSPAERDIKEMRDQYCRSVLFLVLVSAIVGTFLFIQPVLPNYEWDVGA